ncbi:hypothetical protein B0H19DRAFT_1237398 [Mycena capillaripes]|nr:hypothetical protein B0H19DRAFT_1237398 [Mycena capillaripes]
MSLYLAATGADVQKGGSLCGIRMRPRAVGFMECKLPDLYPGADGQGWYDVGAEAATKGLSKKAEKGPKRPQARKVTNLCPKSNKKLGSVAQQCHRISGVLSWVAHARGMMEMAKKHQLAHNAVKKREMPGHKNGVRRKPTDGIPEWKGREPEPNRIKMRTWKDFHVPAIRPYHSGCCILKSNPGGNDKENIELLGRSQTLKNHPAQPPEQTNNLNSHQPPIETNMLELRVIGRSPAKRLFWVCWVHWNFVIFTWTGEYFETGPKYKYKWVTPVIRIRNIATSLNIAPDVVGCRSQNGNNRMDSGHATPINVPYHLCNAFAIRVSAIPRHQEKPPWLLDAQVTGNESCNMGVEQETHKNCAVALAVLLALVDRAVKDQCRNGGLVYSADRARGDDIDDDKCLDFTSLRLHVASDEDYGTGRELEGLRVEAAVSDLKGRWDGRDKKKRRKSERRSMAYSMWGEGEDGGKGKRTKWSPITPSVNPLPMHPHHDALGFE